MNTGHPRIYLASQSPRRRELLAQIGVTFELLHADAQLGMNVDETPHAGELPEEYVLRVCRAKAVAANDLIKQRNLPSLPVLTADTTVALEGEIFGKPENAEHAAAMLRQLSGREHQVHSAVAIMLDGHLEIALSTSRVHFAVLDEARIQRYLCTGEHKDKAGSYGIQGYAGAFITSISGSYSGIMGLPLFETVELLRHFNYPAP